MDQSDFAKRLEQGKYGKNDKTWFPRWIGRYASWLGICDAELPVSVEQAIAFSRTLLKNKTPAWQRLQAIRAIEAYRNIVLHTPHPSLHRIRQTLTQLAARERSQGLATDRSWIDSTGRQKLIGKINPNEPELSPTHVPHRLKVDFMCSSFPVAKTERKTDVKTCTSKISTCGKSCNYPEASRGKSAHFGSM